MEALDDDFLEIPVDGDIEIEVDEPLRYSDDDLNLVHAFMLHEDGERALKKIADEVLDTFDYDWDSSEEYRKQAADDWAVFAGDLPEKDWPYEHSANPNVPIALENITRLHARLMGELFDDWTNIAGYVPTGPDDEEQSEILSLHLNWQLREQIRDFPRQMDRACMAWLIHGDVVCHSTWDPVRRVNVHEVLTVDQFVMPYSVVSTQPDLSDLDHHTKILYLTRKQLEDKLGDWAHVESLLEKESPSWDEAPEAAYADQVNQTQGIATPDYEGPHRILEYEGWFKLPQQARSRWCKVIVHYGTRKVLSLMIHEEPDWRDQLRFEQQQLDRDAYTMQMQVYDENLMQRDLDAEMLETAASTDQIVGPEFRSQAMSAASQIPYPAIPQMPEWMDGPDAEPAPPRMMPIRMYSHGVGIENMAGAHGLALGRIQADHNRAANTLFSQFIDAATQANAWSLIVSDIVEFDRPFTHQPGAINWVKNVSAEDMKNAIRELRPGPANPQLMDALGMIWEKAQSSVQSPNVLSGEPGKSGETFRGISSRIEQATKQLSVVGRKFANTFIRQVLLNNARLNSIFMDDLEIIMITDWRQNMQVPVTVGRDMYRRSYGVEVRADLRFTSEAQKISEAMEMLGIITNTQMLAGNVALTYAAVKNMLEARKQYDLIPLLGPPPPPPQTPLGLPPPGAPPPQGQPQ